ncbi:heme ABC transporter permease [Erythrobacteraceae bacterium CFH 75059]|uniref:heme ABC transporter permease CcmC n=1 Tax=Qipengyuania thermophila TaxID=2509361 RepID=UPI001021B9C4|nr:heme ABC transporter permease CcmC [Qipengyuania thermophila]TCD05025.1 heme ABC transporter permease [Erythrobacteraceae bacterium CFH 75059]
MHGFANPRRFLRLARWLVPATLALGLLLTATGLMWGLLRVPPDRLLGDTVRIMFVHVPAAWLGMGGWAGLTLAGVALLVWRHPLAAIAGRAMAVPGLVFTVICLVTGSIWGRPSWGTWWEWDGRLTSMLVLGFLYIAYIALSDAYARTAQLSAVPAIFALVGAINLPIINRSVVWWNSLHQPASITIGKNAIDTAYLWPLLVSALGMALLFGAATLMRMRALLAHIQAEARLRREASGAPAALARVGG